MVEFSWIVACLFFVFVFSFPTVKNLMTFQAPTKTNELTATIKRAYVKDANLSFSWLDKFEMSVRNEFSWFVLDCSFSILCPTFVFHLISIIPSME